MPGKAEHGGLHLIVPPANSLSTLGKLVNAVSSLTSQSSTRSGSGKGTGTETRNLMDGCRKSAFDGAVHPL
jgi:hypothetical protein